MAQKIISLKAVENKKVFFQISNFECEKLHQVIDLSVLLKIGRCPVDDSMSFYKHKLLFHIIIKCTRFETVENIMILFAKVNVDVYLYHLYLYFWNFFKDYR